MTTVLHICFFRSLLNMLDMRIQILDTIWVHIQCQKANLIEFQVDEVPSSSLEHWDEFVCVFSVCGSSEKPFQGFEDPNLWLLSMPCFFRVFFSSIEFDHLNAFSHDVDVIILSLLNGAWLKPHMVSTSLISCWWRMQFLWKVFQLLSDAGKMRFVDNFAMPFFHS